MSPEFQNSPKFGEIWVPAAVLVKWSRRGYADSFGIDPRGMEALSGGRPAPAGDYWRAWRLVEEVIGDHLVDLIEIETAGESLLRAIERYGVEL